MYKQDLALNGWYATKANQPNNQPTNQPNLLFTLSQNEKKWIQTFPKSISVFFKWNVNLPAKEGQ